MQETDHWVGKIVCSRKWQPNPAVLPGKSHGQRSLVGYSLCSHEELDMTEHLSRQGNHEKKTLRSQVQSSNCWSPWQWTELYRCVQSPCFSRTFVVQLLSHAWFFVTPWTVACQAPLSSTVCQSLLRSVSTESVMLSNRLILCCPFLLMPSIFSSIRI